MKNLLVLFVCLLPLVGFTQKIKKDVINGFTDERTIETSIVSLKPGFKTGLGIALRAQSSNYYIDLIAFGRNNTMIKYEDKVHLIFADGSLVKLEKRINLSYTSSATPNIYIHHYLATIKYIESLERSQVVILRIVSPTGQMDIPINNKNGKELTELAAVFLKAVAKKK